MCPVLPGDYEAARRRPNAVVALMRGRNASLYFADWETANTLSRGGVGYRSVGALTTQRGFAGVMNAVEK